MARHRSPHPDPAADAAALLRRIGFATLTTALPVTALVARRAVVVLAPIGVALLAIAALLDGEHRKLSRSLGAIAASPAALAGLAALAWTALTLLWTPFAGPAADRVGNLAATLAAGLVGYLALPERMRSANLYPLAVGVGAAALLAVGLLLWERPPAWDEAALTLDRGVVALCLLLWPAAAWLHSRERDLQAMALVIATAVAAGLAPSPLAFVGFVTGALVYLLAASRPAFAGRALGVGGAALVLLAPGLPFVLAPVSAALPGDPFASMEEWRRMILAEPLRLVTGFGFETALRGRGVGLVASGAPTTALFDLWIDLGLVGAAALAAAVYATARGAAASHPPVAPGALAALACALAIVVAGAGYSQMWFVTTLVVAALAFGAVERGQFRTQRPKVILDLLLRRRREDGPSGGPAEG